MNTPDYIDPAVGLPLAGILYLAWWLVERHHAHKVPTMSGGSARCGEEGEGTFDAWFDAEESGLASLRARQGERREPRQVERADGADEGRRGANRDHVETCARAARMQIADNHHLVHAIRVQGRDGGGLVDSLDGHR